MGDFVSNLGVETGQRSYEQKSLSGESRTFVCDTIINIV